MYVITCFYAYLSSTVWDEDVRFPKLRPRNQKHLSHNSDAPAHHPHHYLLWTGSLKGNRGM